MAVVASAFLGCGALPAPPATPAAPTAPEPRAFGAEVEETCRRLRPPIDPPRLFEEWRRGTRRLPHPDPSLNPSEIAQLEELLETLPPGARDRPRVLARLVEDDLFVAFASSEDCRRTARIADLGARRAALAAAVRTYWTAWIRVEEECDELRALRPGVAIDACDPPPSAL